MSDHAVVVSDFYIRPYQMRRLPKKIYRFGKADWEKIRAAASDISGKVSMLYKAGEDVDTQWNMFKDAPTDT